jgi:SOS-response transcriptional repressor LexA
MNSKFGHGYSHPNHPYNRPGERTLRAVYAVIVEHLAVTGRSPTNAYIGDQTGLAPNTITDKVRRLVSRGWLCADYNSDRRVLSLPLPDRVVAKLAVIFRLANAELDDLANDQRRDLIMQLWRAKAARQERKAS